MKGPGEEVPVVGEKTNSELFSGLLNPASLPGLARPLTFLSSGPTLFDGQVGCVR